MMLFLADATPFIIHDEESEARYQFSLAASLEQARKEKMLDGWSVYFTSNVQPNRDTFAGIYTFLPQRGNEDSVEL